MSEFQALLLGILQGLTEFLPVSSSGHLEIGHALLGVKTSNNLLFAVVVHLATVLSTLVVFRKDILNLIKDLFKFQWNESTIYVSKIVFSAIPVVILGLFFKEEIEQLFTGNLVLVGSMLIITAVLLSTAHFVKKGNGKITFAKSLIIGIAQALAVLPGISRSGATIAAGLLLQTKKDEIARFSFLMVLLPILGAAFLDLAGERIFSNENIELIPLLIGFLAAFTSGLLACSWMIKIIKQGKLIYFAVYCFIIGLIAIFAA
ncbi:MAG: undecaprenyl-diphosphate phosphatase [Prolixibacteraceae bacterium]|jgi:undecaprenyl-diphosphatase|nr:undecaprenyl-diphosphate phosphatase [Prolixibacteraceae bacterium]MBT6007401.1 undecaprenyl-diphosphate phosphatase [Prolixibacteraceae bacterium]MBT6763785.1 undecaprenyl-diphosphate phosphatase [Prolixibacteraceae bacterium]MBT7001042.1 undecaprenyl-diphosphate phosphatase [Prolixibacteraceae bacterium]MBT7393670.1 undecaprenyl-diphosphate phosphatase [Prolixibacteraceae bacterium]